MADIKTYLYEGLFLLNQQAASSDFAGCVEFMRQVFQRAEAELLVLRKWDERRLAYPIKGQRRGIYLLAYFKARGTQIPNIERDCLLSEQVLRNLILRADHVGETELEVARKDADLSLEAKLRSADDDDRDRDRDHDHDRNRDADEHRERGVRSVAVRVPAGVEEAAEAGEGQ